MSNQKLIFIFDNNIKTLKVNNFQITYCSVQKNMFLKSVLRMFQALIYDIKANKRSVRTCYFVQI